MKIFKNRYFSFLMIYLCLLSIIGMGFSFSKYKSEDTQTDDARIALYDVNIYTGDSTNNQENIAINIYATSKISEPECMIEGTYEKKQINIHNQSECDIQLSRFDFKEIENDNKNKTDIYKQLIIPKTKEEMDIYEEEYDNNIAKAMLGYIGKSETELSDITELDTILNNANELSWDSMEDCILKPGETKTFFIIFWVEHNAVYKEDADLEENSDNISHKTPTELGVAPKKFLLSVHSEQFD